MSQVTIYHNPRCSKSRQTLALITEAGISPTIVEYLKNPPDAEELRAILAMLGLSPRELMRKGEAVYAEKHLGDVALTDEQLIQAMVADPILIERPVVVIGGLGKGLPERGKAIIGRPPENVQALLL